MVSKTLLKKVLLIFIIMFLFFPVLSVKAAVECGSLDSAQVMEMFNVTTELKYGDDDDTDWDDWLIVKFSPTKDALKKVTFKIININGSTNFTGLSLEANYNKALNDNHFVAGERYAIPPIYNSNREMSITFRSNEKNPGCDGEYVEFTLFSEDFGLPVYHDPMDIESYPVYSFNQEGISCPDIGNPVTQSSVSNALNSLNAEYSSKEKDFRYSFCYSKFMAIRNDIDGSKKMNLSNMFSTNAGKTKYSDIYSTYPKLKCAMEFCTEANQINCVPDSNIPNDNGYYINKQYMYGSGSDVETFGNYIYHYSPNEATVGEALKCEKTCEEAVEIEYGPPVAAKAGMCFEYKVKVTSRVSCSVKAQINPPSSSYSYCSPKPHCDWSSGDGYTITYTQGGPNEDFDACIKKCDGGKYTSKCSKKCYKKVYGSSNKVSIDLPLYSAVKLADSDTYDLEKCKAYSKHDTSGYTDPIEIAIINKAKEYSLRDRVSTGYGRTPVYPYSDSASYASSNRPNYGCYYRDSSGRINWSGVNNEDFGRWYLEADHKDLRPYGIRTTDSISGIFRRRKSGGNYCNDNCYWDRCGSGYLNPEDAAYDYYKNKQKYEAAVDSCSAVASCSTSTAEFQISVKYSYTDKNGVAKENETTYFPYSSASNNANQFTKLTSLNNGDSSNSKSGPILDFDGCYNGQKENIFYMTEWGFPGSWIDNKSGALSYEDKTGNNAWQEKKNKFCTPKTTKNVNQAWWNYYMKKEFVDRYVTSIEVIPGETRVERNKCYEITRTTSDTVITKTTMSASEKGGTGWNINAFAKNFGHYQWFIDIDCFYAINSQYTGEDINVTPPIPNTQRKTFCNPPDPSGNPKQYDVRPIEITNMFPDSSGEELTSPTKTGRTPGFNWTENATSTGDYVIKPDVYIGKIQDVTHYSTYSDDELDYIFKLTPTDLSTLKGRSHKYGVFADGEATNRDDGQVVYYKSDLIRKTLGCTEGTTCPTIGALKCNNIKNMTTCYKYE